MNLCWRASLQRQQGLSLVELMVAIALGLLLSLAVMQIFLSSRGVFRLQDSVSRIQEGGRLALDLLSEDIRQAGFVGCRRMDDLGEVQDHIGSGFGRDTIIEAETAGSSTLIGGIDVVAGTDILTLRKGSPQGHRLTAKVAASAGSAAAGSTGAASADPDEGDESPSGGAALDIVVQGNLVVADDTPLIISDCRQADVFAGSPAGSTSDSTTLTTSDTIPAYGTDAEVFVYQRVRYFVGETDRGVDALYRVLGNGQPEEFLEGVESLRFEWGIGTGTVDSYKSTDELTAADQRSLVSARINLLLEGGGTNVVASSGAQAQELDFMGEAVQADGRLRQVFSTTVGIRNRLP